MAKLSNFRRVKDIAYTVDSETLNMRIAPDEFTGRKLQELDIDSEGASPVEMHRFICTFLADLILSWDLVGDDDKPIEPTAENIFDVIPVRMAVSIMTMLQSEMQVNPPTPES